jgi:hypothetical protein
VSPPLKAPTKASNTRVRASTKPTFSVAMATIRTMPQTPQKRQLCRMRLSGSSKPTRLARAAIANVKMKTTKVPTRASVTTRLLPLLSALRSKGSLPDVVRFGNVLSPSAANRARERCFRRRRVDRVRQMGVSLSPRRSTLDALYDNMTTTYRLYPTPPPLNAARRLRAPCVPQGSLRSPGATDEEPTGGAYRDGRVREGCIPTFTQPLWRRQPPPRDRLRLPRRRLFPR